MNSPAWIIQQLELGPMMNLVYLLGCPETRTAAVIDPAWDVQSILRAARRLDLKIGHVLVTHAHPDHINGVEEMLEATDAAVWVHAAEMEYIRAMARLYQIPVEFLDQRAPDFHPVSDGQQIFVGNIPVLCIHTPGHSPGSQCFLAGKHLFSGDTLFFGACGRVDLPGSDPSRMWHSLNRKLKALEDDVILHPGHSYGDRTTSTLGEQKRDNPYLQIESAESFLDAMGAE